MSAEQAGRANLMPSARRVTWAEAIPKILAELGESEQRYLTTFALARTEWK